MAPQAATSTSSADATEGIFRGGLCQPENLHASLLKGGPVCSCIPPSGSAVCTDGSIDPRGSTLWMTVERGPEKTWRESTGAPGSKTKHRYSRNKLHSHKEIWRCMWGSMKRRRQ